MYEWDFTVQEMIDYIEVQVKNGWQTCSLESVARQVGYSSQGALTRAFKEAYGCTPAAYRKNPIPIPLSNTIPAPSCLVASRWLVL